MLPACAMLFALALMSPAGADDFTELVERLRPSVVTLESRDLRGHRTGSGTGFFISSDGLVVTNHHVVAAGPSVALLADESEHAVLGVLVDDEASDVAILKIEGGGYPALPLGTSTPPARGDKVVVIGSPLGLDQTVTQGMISALRPDGLPDMPGDVSPKWAMLQITAGIAPGSSGSPVLTPEGRVVGVAQSVVGGAALYFAVDISAVQALLARAPADGALTPMESPAKMLSLSLAMVAGIIGLAVAPGIWGRATEHVGRWRRKRASKPTAGPRPR